MAWLSPGRLPTAVAALAMLALAAWLIHAGPRSRLNRAFALFLVVQAFFYGTRAIDSEVGSAWIRISAYFAIATPFAALNFALVFWQRHGADLWRRRATLVRLLRSATLLGAVATLAAYAVRHDLYFSPAGPGPLFLFIPLTYTVYAFVAVVAAAGHLRAARRGTQIALLLLAIAFTLEPMFRGSFHVPSVIRNGDLSQPLIIGQLVAHAATLLLALSATALLGLDAWHHETRGPRTGEARLLGLATAAAVTGLAAYVLSEVTGPEIWARTLFALEAFWHLVLVGIATYAVLRYQLFDIDIKFRFVVKQSTFAAIVGLIFVIVSETLERAISVAENTIAIAVAVGIGLLFRWLQQLSGLVARRLLPSILDAPEQIVARKEDIYRATLDGILVDGDVTPKERAILETLARKLELDAHETDRIERELLLAGATSGRAS